MYIKDKFYSYICYVGGRYVQKNHLQIIKFEQNLCNAKVDDNEILFVRVSDIVKSPDACIEAPFTHDAIVIKGGGDVRYYKSGNYDIFDDKKERKDWKKGLSVEVIYIPKDLRVLIRWGTHSRVRYRDETSSKVITVGARGEFDVSVTNPEQFFRKIVGVKKKNLTCLNFVSVSVKPLQQNLRIFS